MKRRPKKDHDPLALDQVERIMAHHRDLLAAAEQNRLLKQIPNTGKSGPGFFKTLLYTVGNALIALGEQLKTWGKENPTQEDLSV